MTKTRDGIHLITTRRIILATIILLALCGIASAGLNVWTGNLPFPNQTGHRAVHALAISPDGSVIYSGLDTGTVMSLTFDQTPAVTNVEPASGPLGGNTFVTITGSHFTGVLAVRFGDTDATGFDVVSSTEINATVPAGSAAGPVNIRVITPSGISPITTDDVYTYTGPADRLSVSAPSTATAGSPFTVTVTALDSLGSTSSDYDGRIRFASNDSTASLPLEYRFVPATDSGSHTFTLETTLNTAGIRTISVNDTVTDTINGQSIPITVSPGPVTQYAVSAPSPVTSGTSFSLSVTSLDAQWNTNTTYAGTVHFTSTDAAAVLPGDSHLTAGHGSFSTILNTTPSQTIIATDTADSTITGNTGPITVNPGPAARFEVTASTTVTAGTALPTLTVTALDADGNTNSTYSGTVRFGSTDSAASLPPEYTFDPATDSGSHTFTLEALLRTAGTQTINATDMVTSSTTGTSNTITVVPAAADHFTIFAPAAATAGVPVEFSVTAVDQFGNTDPSYAGTVGFTSSDAHATLPSGSTLINGARTFSATFATAGTQTISVSDGTLDSTPAGIIISATSHFAVSAPSSATRGTTFTFSVNALDDSNNIVAGYPGTIHFTSTDPSATLPADATLTGGTGTFTVTLNTAGTQAITATDTASSLINGTSGAISVTWPTQNPTVNPTPGPDPLTDIDTGSGSGGNAGTGGTTGMGTGLPLMTVTVNIGGDSNAWQAIVSGTKLSELIVTGTGQHGGVSRCTAPAGNVNQYLNLEPARYGTITNAVINFTIPQSWLDNNRIAPGGVVMYSMTADCWKPLPTTFLSAKDGTAYFSASSSGFSQFAIAGTPGAFITTPQQTGPRAVQPPATSYAAKAPVVTQTTVPPAPAATEPDLPYMTAALIGAGCIVLIGGGWYVRRWWIRRQNPALFAEYD